MNNFISLFTANMKHSHWPDIAALRRMVFIEEQNVPEHEEWDAADAVAIHIAALYKMENSERVIGCARLLDDGQIGRMAVMQEWRGRGAGGALLQFALGVARRKGMHAVFLNAQTHAIGFYQRYGFVVMGDEFMDAGIPHKRMERALP